jgi:hypothetical protein
MKGQPAKKLDTARTSRSTSSGAATIDFMGSPGRSSKTGVSEDCGGRGFAMLNILGRTNGTISVVPQGGLNE